MLPAERRDRRLIDFWWYDGGRPFIFVARGFLLPLYFRVWKPYSGDLRRDLIVF